MAYTKAANGSHGSADFAYSAQIGQDVLEVRLRDGKGQEAYRFAKDGRLVGHFGSDGAYRTGTPRAFTDAYRRMDQLGMLDVSDKDRKQYKGLADMLDAVKGYGKKHGLAPKTAAAQTSQSASGTKTLDGIVSSTISPRSPTPVYGPFPKPLSQETPAERREAIRRILYGRG